MTPTATDLLTAELAYAVALRTRVGVTEALHALQRIRAALGLRIHLP